MVKHRIVQERCNRMWFGTSQEAEASACAVRSDYIDRATPPRSGDAMGSRRQASLGSPADRSVPGARPVCYWFDAVRSTALVNLMSTSLVEDPGHKLQYLGRRVREGHVLEAALDFSPLPALATVAPVA